MLSNITNSIKPLRMFIFKILIFPTILFVFSFFGYGQGNTVTVQTQTPDGSTHAGETVKLDNDALNLHYDADTDTSGKVVFSDVPTPVEDENPMVLSGYRLDPGYPNPVNNALKLVVVG